MALINCPECGKEISDKAPACPHCGCPVVIAPPEPTEDDIRKQTIERLNAQEQTSKAKRKRTTLLIIGIVIAVCAIAVLIVLRNSSPKHDFHNLKDIIEGEVCVISDDGKTMRIDTNPDDIKDKSYGIAMYYIESANEQLNIPDSVLEKMYATRALDGRQEATYGHITISWSYHPKTGLEAIYEIN